MMDRIAHLVKEFMQIEVAKCGCQVDCHVLHGARHVAALATPCIEGDTGLSLHDCM